MSFDHIAILELNLGSARPNDKFLSIFCDDEVCSADVVPFFNTLLQEFN
jgi:hypothetical protein